MYYNISRMTNNLRGFKNVPWFTHNITLSGSNLIFTLSYLSKYTFIWIKSQYLLSNHAKMVNDHVFSGSHDQQN